MKIYQKSALLLELTCWAALPVLFLDAYLSRIEGGEATQAAHFGVYVIWLALWLAMRISAPRGVGAWQRASRCTAGVLGAALLFALLCYYGLVLLGLDSWGRVVTFPILMAYLNHMEGLAITLGLQPLSVLLLACSGAIAIAAIGVAAQNALTHTLGGWMIKHTLVRSALIFGLLGFATVQAGKFIGAPRHDANEPFALSVFPERQAAQHNYPMATESLVQARLDRSEREEYAPSEPRKRPNVILIVGDALRADAISILGNPRPVTPFIDSMQTSGAMWWASAAYSSCAESYCGLMGISKSRYQHGITRDALSLHDVLRVNGYKVKLLFGGDHTNFYGLSKAFGEVDLFRDGSTASEYMNDDSLVVRYTEELPRQDSAPVFLHYHLMSTHGLGLRTKNFQTYQPAVNYYSALAMARVSDHVRDVHVRNFYDNGVSQFDFVVSSILETLRAKGYLENAVVIVTGDHGEQLGEHGMYSHANSVFEAALRVPLLISSYPSVGASTGRNDANSLVSTVDIAPTITNLLGIETPKGWVGRSLFVKKETSSPSDRVINFWQGDKVGVIAELGGRRVKYWYGVNQREEAFFNLSADPNESLNLMLAGNPNATELDRMRSLVAHLIPSARTARFEAVEAQEENLSGRY